MKRKDIIKALQIAERLNPDQDICAEHDVIYFLHVECDGETKKELTELGAHFDDDTCSWSIFV